MTLLRRASRKGRSDNIEFGEAIFALLKRKAERQLEIIAPTHDERVVEVLRALVDMHEVQVNLVRERYRPPSSTRCRYGTFPMTTSIGRN